ncbi:MAG: hypothetical protein D6748_09225 [Calditrichaeota bacterium]|nr:MAG: hypothetical protein D6748_09225 [Calditrichota bacterium]
MLTSYITLTLGLAFLGLGIALLRPNTWFREWRYIFRNRKRILIEDALKHLHDHEYRRLPATLQSLAGALAIGDGRAVELVKTLEALGLVRSQDHRLHLTEEGRAYARRVIRIHRLWERYLADQTGLPEQTWHSQAERQEHRMSIQEANRLAARMGNPPYDPHGDPIPTAGGDMPPPRGVPLTDLPEGEFGEIVHLEDEPETVYAQLVALGLYPGMEVQMLKASPERIRIAANGEEFPLAPIVAANVTVEPLSTAARRSETWVKLSHLKPGDTAVVTTISRACRGLQRRRLMDLGLVPGTTVEVEFRSAAGDPTAYRVRGAVIALRKDQADLIYVEKMESVNRKATAQESST